VTEPAKDPDPKPRRLSSTAWAVLTALLALAGSVVSLAFTLWPSLKPDPLDQEGAALSVVAIEPNVRIEDWAKHAYPKSWERHLQDIFGVKRPSPGNLGNRGAVIYVRTQVDGYKHRSVSLLWSVHKVQTGSRLPYEKLIVDAPEVPRLNVDAPDRSSIQLLFIPSLNQLDPKPAVFVRVELVDGSGTLAIADTPPLRHAIPHPALTPSSPSP
jgi:hypothetical protein